MMNSNSEVSPLIHQTVIFKGTCMPVRWFQTFQYGLVDSSCPSEDQGCAASPQLSSPRSWGWGQSAHMQGDSDLGENCPY